MRNWKQLLWIREQTKIGETAINIIKIECRLIKKKMDNLSNRVAAWR